ncbi:transcriptional adapter 2B-like isoform X2 [Macrosteles quadrilineatus]|uniref:transcriptional adapter 2B-like isoform X2 n=1 Tax=Macrosteles quadrilineatus TaxID=74068 RepID=UPI0023E284E9|nr:transcriptional adapter 2B-like isoform X2 [Macrosteles quadrilineatus]XP_054281122.1 transcriptional adapter 2B-like isoform X2 [Macrosteles quadrilineatus]
MSSDVFNTYRCSHCQYKIDGLRVRCATCSDFEMCLQCFTNGAEIGPHRNDHPYQFVDSVALDVFGDRSGWSALEELNLLNAIEHYSFGNWKDIAQHIGTRNADEAREEYINRFLEGSIGQATWPTVQHLRPVLRDLVGEDDGPLAGTVVSNLPPLDIRAQEAQQLDYYPLRDDFEIEYDNMAETLVSGLTLVSGEDDDLDIALKLTQVDMYTMHLRERERRHRVLRDFQLISKFFRNKERKRISKDERAFKEKLLPFCKYHTSQEHEQFMEYAMAQRKLSRRLAELLRYRRFGLKQFEELPTFEKERIIRQSSAKPEKGELSPLGSKKKRKKHKKKLLFSARKIHTTKRPFFRLGYGSSPI